MVEDRPKTDPRLNIVAKIGFKMAADGSSMAQNGSRWPKIAPKKKDSRSGIIVKICFKMVANDPKMVLDGPYWF